MYSLSDYLETVDEIKVNVKRLDDQPVFVSCQFTEVVPLYS